MAIKRVDGPGDEPYGLDPGFERAVVYHACTNDRFWATAAHVLDPALLGAPEAKLLVQGAAAYARDAGRAPASGVIVLQRLRAWVTAGRHTQDEVAACAEYLDAAEDDGLPDAASVLAELVPMLRSRIEYEALERGLKLYQSGNSPAGEVVALLDKAKGLGKQSDDFGTSAGVQSAQAILRVRDIVRFSTMVPEFDDVLNGGAARRTLSCFIGSTGSGKSMMLHHMAVAGIVQGFNVAIATLEVPSEIWHARTLACALASDTDAILFSLPEAEIVRQTSEFARNVRQCYGRDMGRLQVKDFPAKVTTPRDIRKWVESLERRDNCPYYGVIIDYADKLRPSGKSRGEDKTYTSQGDVYEELFDWVKETNRWGFTAAQATRQDADPDKIVLDENDMSDSLNKARVLDLLVSVNPRDNKESTFLYVPKHRYGKPCGKVGPLPTAFSCARIVPVNWFVK